MRRPRRPLWHNGDFLLLWGAQSVSQAGSQVTGLALPLAAILVLKATTFEVAALNVVDLLPFALFSLPAGVWVDRLRRLGRTNASRRFVVWGVMPFGGLIGGALGSALGLRAALWVGAIGCSLAFVALLPSPLRRIRVVEDAEALT